MWESVAAAAAAAAAAEFWKRARAYGRRWTRDEYDILQIRGRRPSMRGHVPRIWICLTINSKSRTETYANTRARAARVTGPDDIHVQNRPAGGAIMSEMEWWTVKREKMQRLLSRVIHSLTHVPSRRGKPLIFCVRTDHPGLFTQRWRKNVSCGYTLSIQCVNASCASKDNKGIRNLCYLSNITNIRHAITKRTRYFKRNGDSLEKKLSR